MYLEKLEIQGFKSFANKNKLIFPGLLDVHKRGLTAVVGPNGSGKSNVADSIRWALGEQSLKTLRGKKSEDVIFSGSDKKNQLGLAEVSLYLNNSEAKKNKVIQPTAIEKESDLDQIISGCPEIVITRRIYRNGESEYLLNGSRVRLTDTQMLLAKANFGQKTYSVIGQGMVENFLNSSAAERKDFFDEATGVKQFQIKRDSALNKLEGSYENLRQVDMLLTEIKPRLKSLTRQVDKLKRRGEIEGELKTTQLNYYGSLWQEINQKLNSFNGRFLELEKTKLEREKKLTKLNEELNKIRSTDNFREINELQPRFKDLENQRNQFIKQLTKLQAELEVQLESQGQFDVSWLNNKQEELKIEQKNIALELISLDKADRTTEESVLQLEITDIDRALEKNQEQLRVIEKLTEDRNQYSKQISRLEAILEANLEVQGQFDVSWLNNKQEELNREQIKITAEIEELQKQSSRTLEEKLNGQLNNVRQKIANLNQELIKINQKIKSAGLTGNQPEAIGHLVDDFLKELEAIGQENNLEKIKKSLSAAKINFQTKIDQLIKGDHGADLDRIKQIQTEIISLTEERQEINDQLNSERLKLASNLERLRLLTDQTKQLTREITDINAKLAKAQVKFDASKITEEKSSLLKKIESINQQITSLQRADRQNEWLSRKQEVNNKLQECRLKISSINERRRLLTTKQEQLIKEILDIETKLSKTKNKFDGRAIELEKKNVTKKIESLDKEIKDLNDQLTTLNEAQEKEKGQMFEGQKNIQTLQQELNSLLAELNNLRVEATRQETKLEDLEVNIRNDELDLTEIANYRPNETVVVLDVWQKKLNSYKLQLEQIGGIDPETEKEYTETKERSDFLTGQTEDLNKAIKSLEEIIYELDLNIKNRFDGEFKIISEKFNEYFKILFSGGSAKISKLLIEDLEKEENKNNNPSTSATSENSGLTPEELAIKSEVDDKLKRIKFLRKHNAVGLAGIDIQATPPGKKIQAVAMLSGGERALTAIALICAIISANPSPFVVLDEVDAALDEANSERLAQILDDLSNKTQFIVITHNRASMRRASILYGVTMGSDGVSQLLSVKLDDLKK